MTDTVLIETKGLQKSFGDNHVLKGVDLQIHQGEALAIIGPSGGGKSTFLRCLNLLEEPDGGDVIFEGQKINQKGTDVDKYRQKMGMVFQHFNVFPHMTRPHRAPRQEGRVPPQALRRAEAAAGHRAGPGHGAGRDALR